MNFEINQNNAKKWLREDVVPVMVLMQCWKDSQYDMGCETDLIFLLLQIIQRLCREEKEQPLVELVEKVKTQCGEAASTRFITKLKSASCSLYSFMSLFDDVEKMMVGKKDTVYAECKVDVDVKGSIFGVFISRCHMEFSKLTFTQTKRIFMYYKKYVKEALNESSVKLREDERRTQVEYDFLEKHLQAMDHHKTITSLHYNINSPSFSLLEQLCQYESAGHSKAISGQFHVVGMATLLLSAVQRRFGHQREAASSLREAIMLAHEEQLSDILDYAVLWLHQFHSHGSGDNLTAFLKYLSHHAQNEKLYDLLSWTNLKLTNQKLVSCSTPLSCITDLQNQLKDLVSVDDKAVITSSPVLSATCAYQVAAWQQYGLSAVSLLYAQLQAHMIPHEMANIRGCYDILRLRQQQAMDNLTNSVCCCALQLFRQARVDDALRLLNTAADHMISHGYTTKVVQQCRQELLIKRAVLSGHVEEAEEGVAILKTLDEAEASYWQVVLCEVRGNPSEGFRLATNLLEETRKNDNEVVVNTSVDLQARLLLLLAQLLGDHLSQLGQAMIQVQRCITLCQQHHHRRVYIEAILYWASLQIQAGSHEQCMNIVIDHMIQIKANGSLLDQSMASFLLVQAHYFKNCTSESSSRQVAMEVLPLLDQAVSGFQQCQTISILKQSLLLQNFL
ncbi:anaphase-promoting complex subunit 5-like isoform X2 [Dysidea avara]|uniref:anaphase-promoting complex subunit 5-like isoform X2 n=1 Tax=Dysidea avara TaxID=196820 RepID=UPI00332EBE5C